MSRIDRITAALKTAGFSDAQLETIRAAIGSNPPPKAYIWAVIFLGLATLVLVVGGVILAGKGVPTPEPLWTAVGAGLGGLAGIFMGQQDG